MSVDNRALVGTYEFDPVSGYVSPSFSLCEIFGTGADAHLQIDAFLGFVHTADRERVNQAIRSTDRADNTAFVCRIVRPDENLLIALDKPPELWISPSPITAKRSR